MCYCADITPISISRHHLVVLQHPNEVKRCLRTTKILDLSLPASHYHLYQGKRFTAKKYPTLHQLVSAPDRETVLLYPDSGAEPLESLEPINSRYNVIILDGTWSQARVLFNSNPLLRALRRVKVDGSRIGRSQYVIRTQPTEICLSTVEAAALAISFLEADDSILPALTKPLKTICDFQLDKGAVEHQSKQFMITNGLYTKPLNKRIRKQLDSGNDRELKNLLHLFDR